MPRRLEGASVLLLAIGTVLLPGWGAALPAIVLLGIAFGSARDDGLDSPVAVASVTWACVGLATALSFGLVWPIPQMLGLIVAVTALGRAGLPRPAWSGAGTADRTTLLLAIVTIPLTTVALVGFIASGRTDLETATEGLDAVPVWVLPLAGLGFALVNPTVEEVLFRGVLQEMLVDRSRDAVIAIVGQAVAFGAIHLDGVPGGPLGMAMAGGWGAVLGLVRHRSGSIRLAWIVHVTANITIFTTVTVLAVRDGVL